MENGRLVLFLPAERESLETVKRQAALIAQCPAAEVLAHLPMGVVVMNPARQIVYANDRFRELTESGTRDVLGQRLGEALSCLGSELSPGGCGTSEMCRSCGAAKASFFSRSGQDTAVGECSISRRGDRLTSLDFHIWMWTMPVDGEMFHAAVLSDTRAEKRLALMERIFYHDILNLVSGMQGLCELMREEEEGQRNAELDLLLFAVDRITDLIHSQRDFTQAERGEYEVMAVKMGTVSLLSDIAALMRRDASCRGKTLVMAPDVADVFFQSDRKLVARILVNMLKNALEATPLGGEVVTGCRQDGEYVRFWVRNPGQVPEEARGQIFRRAFSTKGKGRGLGTYGMKLFAENYLGGEVGFTTDAASGTEFFVRLPRGA